MELSQLASFTLVALLLVISPGPNGLLIAKTVPTSGKPAGFANVAGFLAAFYLHGTLSILGISVILMQSAQVFFIVKILGAIYLIWIGLKALWSLFYSDTDNTLSPSNPRSNRSLSKSFAEGFLTNALNPKVSMFYLAAFPQFIPIGDHAVVYAFLLVFIHSTMNMLWFSSMVILFDKLSGMAKNEWLPKLIKGATGTIFIAFGTKLALLKAEP